MLEGNEEGQQQTTPTDMLSELCLRFLEADVMDDSSKFPALDCTRAL